MQANFNFKDIKYKNYIITYNFYGNKEYTIQFMGDDLIFNTLEQAKNFIDEQTSKNKK